jgi:ferrous iron transport protein A
MIPVTDAKDEPDVTTAGRVHFDVRTQSPEGSSVIPLGAATIGQEVSLVGVEGGGRLQLRLAEMGLVPGARFRVLARGSPGPFIISLRDMRLILGHGMIHRVRVAPV